MFYLLPSWVLDQFIFKQIGLGFRWNFPILLFNKILAWWNLKHNSYNLSNLWIYLVIFILLMATKARSWNLFVCTVPGSGQCSGLSSRVSLSQCTARTKCSVRIELGAERQQPAEPVWSSAFLLQTGLSKVLHLHILVLNLVLPEPTRLVTLWGNITI